MRYFVGNNEIKIHFFDMDHTLINNDCDVSWKEFLTEEKIAPSNAMEIADKFFDDYNRGELDFNEFIEFQLSEFIGRTPEEMAEICRRHFSVKVKDKIYQDAFDYIQNLKKEGCKIYILTSTNTVIARSVADYFGVDGLLGTELKIDGNGKFDGKIDGIYAAQEGKVAKAEEFCRLNGCNFTELAYYGDSINDANILSAVGKAYAVNPSNSLRELAEKNGWEILKFN